MFRHIPAIAALCLVVFAFAFPAAALSDADKAAIASHKLTLDELHRMEAIAQELGPDQPDLDLAGAPSLDDMAAQINANPKLKALLEKHGMAPRDLLVATFSLVGAVMAEQMGGGADNPNSAFYREHKAEIDAYMNQGDDDDSGDDGEDPDDLTAYDGEQMGECVKVGMAPVALMPLAVRGSIETTPQDRENVAKTLSDLSEKVKAENIRKDLTVMSDEVRRQAHNKRMVDTPQFTGALDDLKAWLETNCSKDALTK